MKQVIWPSDAQKKGNGLVYGWAGATFVVAGMCDHQVSGGSTLSTQPVHPPRKRDRLESQLAVFENSLHSNVHADLSPRILGRLQDDQLLLDDVNDEMCVDLRVTPTSTMNLNVGTASSSTIAGQRRV
jgi:hypothetical protein